MLGVMYEVYAWHWPNESTRKLVGYTPDKDKADETAASWEDRGWETEIKRKRIES